MSNLGRRSVFCLEMIMALIINIIILLLCMSAYAVVQLSLKSMNQLFYNIDSELCAKTCFICD